MALPPTYSGHLDMRTKAGVLSAQRTDTPKSVKSITRDYYSSVGSVDRNVGRLLDRLDSLKLTERTLVVFTSDHGYMIGHHGMWHKGNGVYLVTTAGGFPNQSYNASNHWLHVLLPASAQDIITTAIGGGPNGIPALNANVYNPLGVAVDTAGNDKYTEYYQHRVFKVNAAGTSSVVAGSGALGYTGDGAVGGATNASLA